MKIAPKRESVVYFLGSAGLVKIGWTKHLQARMDALTEFSPLPSVLLGYGPGPKTREGYLHGRFAADDWRAKSFPEYQNVRLDEHGTEYLERIDWLEPLEVSGQIDLFGGAA
jgi:hypothetical protein